MSETRQLQLILDLHDNATKQLQGFRGQLEKMRPAFQKMAGYGTVAFAGIAAGIGKAVQEAGNAEKIAANFENTFGESSDEINRFIQDFGNKFAFVESEMRDGATSIGFQLSAMGDVGAKEGEKITESLLTAAGGLSDFFGEQMSVVEASRALSKGLAGNRAQLIDMGFNVLEDDLGRAAAAMGKNYDEMTKLQEAQLFTKLIMEQTAGSVEGLNTSLDTFTGQQRAAKKAITETTQILGETFLDSVKKVQVAITPVIEKIGMWIKENPKLTRNIIIVTAALAGFVAIAGTVGLLLLAISGPAIAVTAAFVAIGAISVYVIQKWDIIKQLAATLRDAVVGMADSFVQTMSDIKKAVSNAVSATIEKLQAFWNKWRNLIIYVTGVIVGLYLPKLTLLAAHTTAKLAVASAQWVAHTAKVSAQIAIQTVKSIPRLIAMYTALIAKTTATAVWVVGRWVFMAAQSLIQAARMATAWIIAMGPIAWIIALVVGLVALIIANWSTVKAKTIEIWKATIQWLKNAWSNVKEFFADVWDSMLDTIEGWVSKAMDFLSPLLDAISTIGKGIGKGVSGIKSALNVDDAIITPQGQVIKTNPADYLIATKRPQDLGSGGSTVINITGTFGSDAAEEIGDQIIKRLQLSNKFT